MDASSTTPNTAPAKKEPEKHIRTFAGDMDALKKGGTPDHVPLDAVAPPKPVVAPPAVPLTEKAPPGAPAPQSVVAPPTFIPTAPVPSPAAIVSPPVVAPPPKNPPLQTYANDFSERMKNTHATTATVLAAEQDKPRVPQVAPPESSPISLPYVIAGLVLLVVSISGGIIAFMHYRTTSAPVISTPSMPTSIFVDEREEIAGTGPILLQAITSSVNRPLAAGTVRLLYVASTDSTSSPQATGTEHIFSSLPLSTPDVLLRNMSVKETMTGVINVGGNQSPFFILSVLSYSNVLSGMLAWEPLMPEYLSELFPLHIPQSGTSTVATTSTSSPRATTSTASAYTAGFYDATIINHDVRVYRDTTGRDVLLYGFWNQETLIIARDTAAFTEIVGRLGTARAQ